MNRFYFNKLVRDSIVQNFLDDPKVIKAVYRTLDDEAYHRELLNKITEEAEEIPYGGHSDEALEELADLQCVVDALRDQLGFSEDQVRKAVNVKSQKKGKFELRHYVDYVDLAPDSEWIAYFRSQSGKYKEGVIEG